MIAAAVEQLGAWTWFVLAIALLVLELAIPGTFVFWLGLAAAATGVLAFAVDLHWQTELIAFAGFSVLAVFAWWRFVRGRTEGSDRPTLNRRAEAHVGREFTLAEPIVGGSGRVRIDDSTWRIKGPDCPAGTRVKVQRTDGVLLVVEPL